MINCWESAASCLDFTFDAHSLALGILLVLALYFVVVLPTNIPATRTRCYIFYRGRGLFV